jgi:hypothetical protein
MDKAFLKNLTDHIDQLEREIIKYELKKSVQENTDDNLQSIEFLIGVFQDKLNTFKILLQDYYSSDKLLIDLFGKDNVLEARKSVITEFPNMDDNFYTRTIIKHLLN